MRADRLVATLLFMQQRGRVTAGEVAAELEISVATARRDLEALSTAGIPVYPQPGRGGGWQLVGGARTDLSGLNADEAQALFLLLGPVATAAPATRSALRKLLRALPQTFRAEAEAAADAVVVDPARWGAHDDQPPPLVAELQRAVVRRRRIRFEYRGAARGRANGGPARPGDSAPSAASTDRSRPDAARSDGSRFEGSGPETGRSQRPIDRSTPTHRRNAEADIHTEGPRGSRSADPWGLVDKDGIWYLVAGTDHGQRVFRVDRMDAVEVTTETAARPADFDLAAAWSAVVEQVEGQRALLAATVLVPAQLLPVLRHQQGRHCEVDGPVPDGRILVRITAPTPLMIAQQLAGWGAALEVTGPDSVRAELARLGAELVDRYRLP
ncbi:helix-turn-helix transcriptional regulator [Nocardia yamanashiensis]|uniref:helix-turn-helix transcriptional regulator n=1 Tax=Nocardia yamanashiensis TaxID=209247 RepID=UPI000A0389C5|nr:WYL domain-containing protein [Nocardia yamanashiensis]